MGTNFYRVNKRNIDFVLNEQLRVEQLCELEKYRDFDRDDFDMIISESIKFATEVLGPLNQDADRVGAHFENGDVKAGEIARNSGAAGVARTPPMECLRHRARCHPEM